VSGVDDEGGGEVDLANRRVDGVAVAVLEHIARSIVDDPDAVVVESSSRGRRLTLELHVAPGDMGRVIGRRGRVAQAIRTAVRAVGAADDLDVDVSFVD